MNFKKLLAFFYSKNKNLPNWNKIYINSKIKTEKKKNILIATSSGGLWSSLIFESLLGVSLKSRGHEVEYLLCDGILSSCIMCTIFQVDEKEYLKDGPGKTCNSCFINAYKSLKSSGIKIRVLSDFIDKDDESFISSLKFEKKTFEELKKFTLENVPIGEHAYAGTLRYYGVAELDFSDYSKKILVEYMKSGMKSYLASKRLFEKYKYDEVVLNHGIYVPQGIISCTAKQSKINITNWSMGIRKKSFVLTRDDTYYRSLLYEDNDNWQNISFNKKIDNRISSYLESRLHGKNDWIYYADAPNFDVDNLLNEMNVDINKPIIGMPTNVIWDAQIDFPSNFFKNILEWVFFTIEYFAKREDIQLLIRVHPAEVKSTKPAKQRIKDEIMKKYSTLPKNVFIVEADSDISSYALMERCNSVILYSTKMGIELPVKNIPVVVCGEGMIRNKKITLDITSKEHYLDVLNKLPLKGYEVDIIRAKKYAYHYFFRRMISIDSISEKPLQWPNFEINKDLNNILNNRSDKGLEKIISCFEDGSDFIFQDENNIN